MLLKDKWWDKSLNPCKGCTRVSPACDNCYAMELIKKDGGNPNKVTFYENKIQVPLSWRKPCIIFMVSMGDIFHKDVSDEYIDRIFNAMSYQRQHHYMILTKRPERMHKYCKKYVETHNGTFPKWVWIGVTAEDQQRADERLPILLNTPAHHHFVSVEPLLEPIKLLFTEKYKLQWTIVGGEKAAGLARYMSPEWAIDVRDQCALNSVPFFFKQMMNKGPVPADLQIQDYPVSIKPIILK